MSLICNDFQLYGFGFCSTLVCFSNVNIRWFLFKCHWNNNFLSCELFYGDRSDVWRLGGHFRCYLEMSVMCRVVEIE